MSLKNTNDDQHKEDAVKTSPLRRSKRLNVASQTLIKKNLADDSSEDDLAETSSSHIQASRISSQENNDPNGSIVAKRTTRSQTKFRSEVDVKKRSHEENLDGRVAEIDENISVKLDKEFVDEISRNSPVVVIEKLDGDVSQSVNSENDIPQTGADRSDVNEGLNSSTESVNNDPPENQDTLVKEILTNGSTPNEKSKHSDDSDNDELNETPNSVVEEEKNSEDVSEKSILEQETCGKEDITKPVNTNSLNALNIDPKKVRSTLEISESDNDHEHSEIKLDNKDKSKKSSVNISDEIDSKINDLLEKTFTDSDKESGHEENPFLDTMAEEGEEDTPSEGSNDIIEVGEEINTTESELSTDESYENDSFINDEEHHELLSGEEYDLRDDKVKKKSRIIILSSGSDDEIIKISKPKKQPKRKKSRIIKFSDSSDEEVGGIEDEVADGEKKSCNSHENQITSIEEHSETTDKDTSEKEVNDEKVETPTLNDTEVGEHTVSKDEDKNEEASIEDKYIEVNNDTKIDENNQVESIAPNNIECGVDHLRKTLKDGTVEKMDTNTEIKDSQEIELHLSNNIRQDQEHFGSITEDRSNTEEIDCVVGIGENNQVPELVLNTDLVQEQCSTLFGLEDIDERSVSVEVEDDSKVEAPITSALVNLSVTKQHKNGDIVIHENVKVTDIDNKQLSDHINRIIDSLIPDVNNMNKIHVSLSLNNTVGLKTTKGEETNVWIEQGQFSKIKKDKKKVVHENLLTAGPIKKNNQDNKIEKKQKNKNSKRKLTLESLLENKHLNDFGNEPLDDLPDFESKKPKHSYQMEKQAYNEENKGKFLQKKNNESFSRVNAQNKNKRRYFKKYNGNDIRCSQSGFTTTSLNMLDEISLNITSKKSSLSQPAKPLYLEEIKNAIKPSTSKGVQKGVVEYKKVKCSKSENPQAKKFFEKDFKNLMIYDSTRVKRIDTKQMISKRGIYSSR